MTLESPLEPKSSFDQALVWVSSDRARVYRKGPGLPETSPPTCIDREELFADPRPYFERISQAIHGAGSVSLIGPDMMRFHFRIHLQEHHPELHRRLRTFEAGYAPTPMEVQAYFAVLEPA